MRGFKKVKEDVMIGFRLCLYALLEDKRKTRLGAVPLAKMSTLHCFAMPTVKPIDIVEICRDSRGARRDGVSRVARILRGNVNNTVNKLVLSCKVAGQIRPN